MNRIGTIVSCWIATTTALTPASAFTSATIFSRSLCSSRLYAQQTQKQHVIATDENAPRDISAFEDWTYACGVQRAEGLKLVASTEEEDTLMGLENTNMHIMTSVDIRAITPILLVPNFMILSSQGAMEELRSEGMEAAEQRILNSDAGDQLRHYYLMLKILVEYEKGQSSPWFSWLNALPRYFSNAVSMTPFCYKCLPSLMASLALKERANLNHLRVRQVPFLGDDTKSNEALWTWVYQIVYTRSFEGPNGDLRIAPMVDMINHGADTNVELAFDVDNNCVVQTVQDVSSGSPFCMSYGDPTNPSFLFARYGFLDKSSPATFCKYIIDTPTSELVGLGYDPSRMLFYKDTGGVSTEVWDVLLYQILGAQNVQEQRAFYQAHMANDHETKQQFHQQYYQQTASKLLEHIDGFLEKLDELLKKTHGRDPRHHPRLPLILRHNEFVRKTFLSVRARYFE